MPGDEIHSRFLPSTHTRGSTPYTAELTGWHAHMSGRGDGGDRVLRRRAL